MISISFLCASPTISRVYGDYFSQQIIQGPEIGEKGAIDNNFGCLGKVFLQDISFLKICFFSCLDLCCLGRDTAGRYVLLRFDAETGEQKSWCKENLVIVLPDWVNSVSHLIIDSHDDVILVASDSTHQNSIIKISSSGQIDTLLNYKSGDAFNAITLQSNGNFIVTLSNENHCSLACYSYNAQTALLHLVDSFGQQGKVLFNGSYDFPTITAPIKNIIVSCQNSIFAPLINPSGALSIIKLCPQGFVDGNFGQDGIVALDILPAGIIENVQLSFDVQGNIFVAVHIDRVVYFLTISGQDGAVISNQLNYFSVDDGYSLRTIMIRDDSNFVLEFYNLDACTSKIIEIDQCFNTMYSQEFIQSSLKDQGFIIGADGRLFMIQSDAIGQNFLSAYFFLLYPSFVSNFPSLENSPILDYSFGEQGILPLFCGCSGIFLEQKARTLLMQSSGNFLVGLDGKLDNQNYSSIIIKSITSSGIIDTSSMLEQGYIVLQNYHRQEFLQCMICDIDENIYIAGTSNDGMIIRAYNKELKPLWIVDDTDLSKQPLGLAFQNQSRVLCFGQQDESFGYISARCVQTGVLDTTFNSTGLQSGIIQSGDFGLHIGPIGSCYVDDEGTIFIVYKNYKTHQIDCAVIDSQGESLSKNFGLGVGLLQDIFASTHILSNNVAIAGSNDNAIVILSIDANQLIIISLDKESGLLDDKFYDKGQLIIPLFDESYQLQSACILADNSIICSMQNNQESMVLQISLNSGLVDFTWKSDLPGTLLSSFTIDQSSGNLLCAGFSLTAQGSIPFCCKIKTKINGVVIPNFPMLFDCANHTQSNSDIIYDFLSDHYAGMIDYSFNSISTQGPVLNLENLLSLKIGTIKKFFIDQQAQSLFIISDLFDTTLITKLQSDFTLDTSFGVAGQVVIDKANNVQDYVVGVGQFDDQSIYLIGQDISGVWTSKINAQGQIVVPPTILAIKVDSVEKLVKTTNDRILIMAKYQGVDTIVALQSDGVSLDQTFSYGTAMMQLSSDEQLYDIAIDQYDRMYTISFSFQKNCIVVQRLLENGTGIDTSFLSNTIDLSYDVIQSVRLIMDVVHDRLIIAIQANPLFDTQWLLYTLSNLNSVVHQEFLSIDVPNAQVLLQDLVIDSLGNIYVLGKNTIHQTLVIAKTVTSSSQNLELDAAYGKWSCVVPGIAEYDVGPSFLIVSSALSNNKNLYVAMNNQYSGACMLKIFTDNKGLPVSKDLPILAFGAYDRSLYKQSELYLQHLSDLFQDSVIDFIQYRIVFMSNALDGAVYICFSNGENFFIGKFDTSLQVMLNFGQHGLTDLYVMHEIVNMTVDSIGRIIISGALHDNPNIIRILPSGNLDIIFTDVNALDKVKVCAEQKSGLIIAAGYMQNSGVVCGYKNIGTALASSFGSVNSQGYYQTGIDQTLQDMFIDDNDYIYTVYSDKNQHLVIEKIMSNGLAPVIQFASSGRIYTDITACSDAKIVGNNQGVVAVAVMTMQGVTISFFDSTAGMLLFDPLLIQSDSRSRCIDFVAIDENFLGSIIDQTGNLHIFKILGDTGVLDQSFGNLGSISYKNDQNYTIENMLITYDGKILCTGARDGVLFTMRLHGKPYQRANPKMPGRVVAGKVDETFTLSIPVYAKKTYKDFNDLLYLDLAQLYLTPNLDLHGYSYSDIYVYPDGSMLNVCDNGVHIIIFKLRKDFTLDTDFASAQGYIFLEKKSGFSSLYINAQGTIFFGVSASENSSVMIYNHCGALLSESINVNNDYKQGVLTIAQQSNGRVLICSQGLKTCKIFGYTPLGLLDSTFGNEGVVEIIGNFSVFDFVVNDIDQIIVMAVSQSEQILSILTPDGKQVTQNDLVSFGVMINNQMYLAQDNSGSLLIATITHQGFALYFYDYCGNQIKEPFIFNFLDSQNFHLSRLYITTDNKIGIVVFNQFDQKIIIIRLDPLYNLDLTFNQTGFLELIDTGIDNVADIVIVSDSRILLAGGSVISTPSLLRLFGDSYVTIIPQVPSLGQAGTFDITFGENGIINISDLSLGFFQKMNIVSIASSQDGGCYILLDDTVSLSKVIKIDANYNFDQSFGQGGVTQDLSMIMTHMIVDQRGFLLIYGVDKCGKLAICQVDQDTGNSIEIDISLLQLSAIYDIGIQSMGRFIILGQRGDEVKFLSGAALIFNNATGSLQFLPDCTFGQKSLFYDKKYDNGQVEAMFIDDSDAIFILYRSDNQEISVEKILPHGTGSDKSFADCKITSSLDIDSQDRSIFFAKDNNQNSIFLVNGLQNLMIVQVDINGVVSRVEDIAWDSCNMYNFVITDIIVTQLNQIIVFGYDNQEHGQSVIIRLTDQFTLDMAFNPSGKTPGVLYFPSSPAARSQYFTGSIAKDGRIWASCASS